MKTIEQNVNVGIVRASDISFTLNGEYTANDGVFSGRQTVSYADGRISWMGKEYTAVRAADRGLFVQSGRCGDRRQFPLGA